MRSLNSTFCRRRCASRREQSRHEYSNSNRRRADRISAGGAHQWNRFLVATDRAESSYGRIVLDHAGKGAGGFGSGAVEADQAAGGLGGRKIFAEDTQWSLQLFGEAGFAVMGRAVD